MERLAMDALAVAWAAAHVALAAALAVAAAVDLRRRVIPDACCVAVAASGLVRGFARTLAEGEAVRALGLPVLGAVTVLAVMLAAAGASRRLSGRPGVGGGDVKLLCAAGVWAGPVGGLAVVGGACALSVAAWVSARLAFRVLFVLSGHNDVILNGFPTAGGIPLGPGIALTTLVVVLLAPP